MDERHNKVSNAQIVEEALSWLGTPYKHQASCKGAGCDCLGLIRGTYRHFWPEPLEPPAYSPDWAEEGGDETLLMAAQTYLDPVAHEAMQPGHVLLFRYRPTYPAKHAGILIAPDRFIHAQHGSAVVLASLGSWWRRHLASVFSFPVDPNLQGNDSP